MMEHSAGDNQHTRAMAELVSALTYERIPQAVRERIKLLILDTLGCAIHGAQLPWCHILRTALAKVDGTLTTSVWGTSARLSSPHAALINGTQVQGFELDDVHRRGVLHVGAVTLPALIAVAESETMLSGQELLTASVAGYEIGPRVGNHPAGRSRFRAGHGKLMRAKKGVSTQAGSWLKTVIGWFVSGLVIVTGVYEEGGTSAFTVVYKSLNRRP